MTRLACLWALALPFAAACTQNPLYIGSYDAGDVSCVADKDCAAAGGSCCSHVCTNLHEDPGNCGACGTVCTAGYACDHGSCAAVKSPDLAGGSDDCETHGGVCGTSCAGISSSYMQYSCGGDTLCCPPAVDAGVDLSGRNCPCIGASDCDFDSTCVNGVCVAENATACGDVQFGCCGGFCGTCSGGLTCVGNGACQ